jgi:signal peptide peptidase SppA
MDSAVERRETPWAVRREDLPAIAHMARRIRANELSAEEIAAARERQAAAMRGGPRVAGGIAVLTLRGLITPRGSFYSYLFGGGSGGLEAFRENFREALSDTDIAAVLIDIDSPGGSVSLVHETTMEILEARGTKPVVAIANTMAASAAYYIASAADEIVVTPSGEVGSIGVFTVHDDWSKFNEAMGVLPTYISAGKYKTEGNPDEPLSKAAEAAIQETIDIYYDMFVGAVAAGRGVSESDVRGGYGEGRVVTADKAVEMKMADRVETFEETVARLVGGDLPEARSVARALASMRTRAEAEEPAVPQPKAEAPEPDPDPEPEPEPSAGPGNEDDDEEPETAAASVEDRRVAADLLFG